MERKETKTHHQRLFAEVMTCGPQTLLRGTTFSLWDHSDSGPPDGPKGRPVWAFAWSSAQPSSLLNTPPHACLDSLFSSLSHLGPLHIGETVWFRKSLVLKETSAGPFHLPVLSISQTGNHGVT